MKKQTTQHYALQEDIKRLVIARLRTLGGNKRISIGSEGEFNKDQLIERVEKEDSIGKKIMEIQLQYLQSLKEGVFLPD